MDRGAGGGSFDGALVGIGIAGGAGASIEGEWEYAHFEGLQSVFCAIVWIDGNFDGVGPPVAADVVWLDIGDEEVVGDMGEHKEFFTGPHDLNCGGDIGIGFGGPLPGLAVGNGNGESVVPAGRIGLGWLSGFRQEKVGEGMEGDFGGIF